MYLNDNSGHKRVSVHAHISHTSIAGQIMELTHLSATSISKIRT
jgi:hypothetical protein